MDQVGNYACLVLFLLWAKKRPTSSKDDKIPQNQIDFMPIKGYNFTGAQVERKGLYGIFVNKPSGRKMGN